MASHRRATLATAEEIANLVGGTLYGMPEATIERVCTISAPSPNSLCFVEHGEALTDAPEKLDGTVIFAPAGSPHPAAATVIEVADPRLAYARAAGHLFSGETQRSIADSARIDQSARLGRDVFIGENCVVEGGASIGDRT